MVFLFLYYINFDIVRAFMIDENDTLTADIFGINTCLACGKNNNDNYYIKDGISKLCLLCYQLKERKDEDLQLSIDVISKLIYQKISKADLIILHHLMFYSCYMNADTKFSINQTKIAKERNLKQPNVSRSIRNLKKANILKFHEEDNLYSIKF